MLMGQTDEAVTIARQAKADALDVGDEARVKLTHFLQGRVDKVLAELGAMP